MTQIARVCQIAECLLADTLPRRWSHVRAVGRQAEGVTPIIARHKDTELVAAAWLHDIGYAPGIAETGLHALDGARWLRQQGFDERICSLVAYHSCAFYEAEERGLLHELTSEFEDEESAVKDALWYCDMTTGPDGQDLTVHERLAEIRSRYGPEHLVSRFWLRAEPELLAAVSRTEERLEAARIADRGTDQPM